MWVQGGLGAVAGALQLLGDHNLGGWSQPWHLGTHSVLSRVGPRPAALPRCRG